MEVSMASAADRDPRHPSFGARGDAQALKIF
jgi:hypothetical protein